MTLIYRQFWDGTAKEVTIASFHILHNPQFSVILPIQVI